MRKYLILIQFLALAGPAEAEQRPPVDHLAGAPDEIEGWWAAQDEKWIRARELGEKVLRERPNSFAGHFVLGMAMHYGEGDLARSAWHLDLAIKEFEKVYGTEPGDDKPWQRERAAGAGAKDGKPRRGDRAERSGGDRAFAGKSFSDKPRPDKPRGEYRGKPRDADHGGCSELASPSSNVGRSRH